MHQQWADMPEVLLPNTPCPTAGTHLSRLRITQQEACE